jgi:hypothetical protein
MASVTIQGVGAAQAWLQQVSDGARQFHGRMSGLGSNLPYAWNIETGLRYGRPWRKAGPARYMAAGLATIRQDMPDEIVGALPQGAGATNLAFGRVLRRGQQRAQGVVPVRSGALRNSIRVVPGT